MKDKIPKTSLNNYYDLNALEMVEVDRAKKEFNHNAMDNEKQGNALLELQIQELETELYEMKERYRSLETSYMEEKTKNVELVQNMMEYNSMVDEHLTYVIHELSSFEKETATFIEKIVMKFKVRRFKKMTSNIQDRLKVDNNET